MSYILIRLPSKFFQGGKILIGGSAIESEGNFVQPTIVEIPSTAPVVKEELFGPVLYVMKFQVAYSLVLCFLCLTYSDCYDHASFHQIIIMVMKYVLLSFSTELEGGN